MDEKKYLVIELFKEAGVSNFSIPTLEPAGYGYLQKQILNGFENLSYINSQQIATVTVKFHEAIGVFRFRMFQTINPIFWLEFVLKLPVFLFKYLGVESSNIFVKLVQVAYWILGIVIFLKELGLL